MKYGLALLFALATTASAADRVVALSPHLAERACAAGGCEKLVGAVAWSDFPERVRGLPKVGDAFAVNVEQVVALQPDLVLVWAGGTPRATRERLVGLGLTLADVEIRGLDDVAGALERIGTLLDTQPAARSAAQGYRARLAGLRKRNAGRARLRVLYQIEANPIYSVNRDSPISQAIELCGGVNVFADLPALAAPVSREAVLARDPEAIVFTRQDDVAAIRDLWKRSPPVAATRTGALYEVDGNLLDRATPRLLDGIEQLCSALTDARAKIAASRATAPPSRPASAPASAPQRKENPKGG